MKIQAVDTTTKKPVPNTKIQIQVTGKNAGFLSTTTDASGYFQLDDKYADQEITSTTSGKPGKSTTATDNATLYVYTTSTYQTKKTETSGTSTNNK